MSHMSNGFETSIGQLFLNGVVHLGGNYIANALGITQALNQTKLYISLHTGAPAIDSVGAEVSYTGYVRAPVNRQGSFSSIPAAGTEKWALDTNSASTSFSNVDAITFPITPANASGTVTHWGIYDASTGGNLLFHGPLVASNAEWRIGYSTGEDDANNTNAAFVFSRAHGLLVLDKIRAYDIYDGALGNGSYISNARYGTEFTVSTVSADSFVLSSNLTLPGGILFIKSSSITLTAGKIPSIPAGGMKLRFA